ncbi:MAG TPA: FAD-binding protein, partial [Chloroflexota bacterium]|nr:FAD-binding protein [Chloroflexota bacterium]
HGANRLGGNGVAESTVFGARAGDTAAELCQDRALAPPDESAVERTIADVLAPLGRASGESPFKLREAIQNLMWERVGLVRDGEGLDAAVDALQALEERAGSLKAPGGRVWNLTWQEAINVRNLIVAARLTALAARHRRESRGSHYRRDLPTRDDDRWLVNVHQRYEDGVERIWETPVALTRLRPEQEAGAR